jgi:cytosine/adenosine deaminase-related metal-dependent hydrolase
MRFIQADIIYPVHTSPVKNGLVVTDGKGTILDILLTTEGIEETAIEKYSGSICPGFINTHCHLELSHLLGKLSQKRGLIHFAKEVMGERGKYSIEHMQEAMEKADKEMQANGIVAVGDISNVSYSFGVKAKSAIHYHTFIELIGLNPANADKILQAGAGLLEEAAAFRLPASIVPHAPYSTSGEVMQKTAAWSKKYRLPLSIHNQESREENSLFENKSGEYLELYKHLNISIDYFEATGKSSLKSYLPSLEESHSVLLVHNTFSSTDDFAYAGNAKPAIWWCLCPNANLYIENKLPDVAGMLKKNCRITIGTDSLASNHALSVAGELQVLQANFPSLTTEQLLTWATWNGAQFLQIEDQFGSLEKGKKPGLVLFDEKDFRVKKVLA